MGISSEGTGTDPRSAVVPCSVCKQELALCIAPNICHSNDTAIAHAFGIGCQPSQLLKSDVDVICDECTKSIRIRNVAPGYSKRSECPECFAKLNFAVRGAEVLGTRDGIHLVEQAREQKKAYQQVQTARRLEREMGIRVDTPLPENGTCKHFTKSYRWLRFPCCSRAFPCPECHDERTDHPHEWANRMLCGRCSFEQPFTKDKCTHCGAAQTRAKTGHWEGGDGCRNTVTMSKKDSHKYKNLGKVKAAASTKK